MNIIRLAGELFLVYIIYKLIFDFIIPLYNTTKTVRKQFNSMHSKMQEQVNKMNQQTNTTSTAEKAKPTSGKKAEDYIDYEEVR